MKFFQTVKEILSKQGELHFKRFAIIETARLSLYIHTILLADEDLHLHSHPWNFISLILKGSYLEETPFGWNEKKFLTLSTMGRNQVHKIERITKGSVFSLFLTYGEHKPWFYQVGTEQVESSEYRALKCAGNLPT